MLNLTDMTSDEPVIIQNALRIVEGDEVTYLISVSRHHYNTYTFKNGATVSVDGGREYIRRGASGNLQENGTLIENYNLHSSQSLEVIADKLLWGSCGVSGKEKIKYAPIKTLELNHLKSILSHFKDRPAMLPDIHRQVINYWIEKKS